MIIKALLASFGLRALPSIYDARVHDAKNDETAAISGFRVVARHSLRVAQTIAENPDDPDRIAEATEKMRTDTDQVRGMLAGLVKRLESGS